MALQVLKESSLQAAKRRLNPPSSPSRSSSSSAQVVTRVVYKSKMLLALDAEFGSEYSENLAPGAVLSYKASGLKAKAPQLAERLRHAIDIDGRHVADVAGPSRPNVHLPNTNSTDASEVLNAALQPEGSLENPATDELLPEDIIPVATGPPYSYKDYKPLPTVIYSRHEGEADQLADSLKGPLGFDMEWKVVWHRGASPTERPTAVVQLSDRNKILILQISAMRKFPQKVKEIIEDPSRPKIGANIAHDGRKLLKDYGVHAANLVELGALARHADPDFPLKRSIVSLAKMVEIYCDGKVLEKGAVRTSDWNRSLTAEQLHYAANDAHCALMAYRRIIRIATIHQRNLDPAQFTSNIDPADPIPAVPTTAPLRPGPIPPTAPPETTSKSSSPPAATVSQRAPQETTASRTSPSPQHGRAYRLWHHQEKPLDEIRALLRSEEKPLAKSTVISYVVWALQADPSLPYSMERLKALVQQDQGSWVRHRRWIQQQVTWTNR